MKKMTFKERIKEMSNETDFLKCGIIIVPLLTLAISSVLILDLMKVNERLTGITFFIFILSGLLSAFNAFKLKRFSKDGVIATTITLVITLTFMIILVIQLSGCIGKQANLKTIFDLKSLFIYAVLGIFYIYFLYCLISRYVKANYGSN